MSPVAPYLESPPPRGPERRTPGRCRICGCTDDAACIQGGGGIPELGYTATCSWIEDDLCSRCHGPRRPTRWQAGELARIRDRKGPIAVAASYGGRLLVAFETDNADHPRAQITLEPGPPPAARYQRPRLEPDTERHEDVLTGDWS